MNDQYWTKSWNPLKVKGGYHCTKCSPGCLNCWAEKYNNRFGNKRPYDDSPVEYVLDQRVLEQPLHWKTPQVVFVCDLCDWLHCRIPSGYIAAIVATIARNPQHTFLTLTKRPERLAGLCKELLDIGPSEFVRAIGGHGFHGLTICNQPELDEKASDFLQIPGHKWLAIEPMLGPLDLKPYIAPWFCEACMTPWFEDELEDDPNYQVDGFYRCPQCLETNYEGILITPEERSIFEGVVVGGESGPGARPMHPDWARSTRDQCAAASVPFFFKQWGRYCPLLGEGMVVSSSKKVKYIKPGPLCMFPVGKKAAGRLLDGREHNELAWKA